VQHIHFNLLLMQHTAAESILYQVCYARNFIVIATLLKRYSRFRKIKALRGGNFAFKIAGRNAWMLKQFVTCCTADI